MQQTDRPCVVVTAAMAISKITRRRSAACKKAVGGRSRSKARSVTAAGARSRSRRRASVVPAALRRRGRSRSRDSGSAARYTASCQYRGPLPAVFGDLAVTQCLNSEM